MKKYIIKVNGVSYEVEVEEAGTSSSDTVLKQQPAAPQHSIADKTDAAPSGSAGAKTLSAPMPGGIIKVNVKPGDNVKKGAVLLVLEAMKMENDITAPEDCTISSVNVSQGSSVSTGDTLITYN